MNYGSLNHQAPALCLQPEGGPVEEIGLLLEPSLLKRLEEAAQEQSMSVASLIRLLLREFLHPPAAAKESSGSTPVSIMYIQD